MLIDGFVTTESGVQASDIYVVSTSPTVKLAFIPDKIDLFNDNTADISAKLKRFMTAAAGEADVVVIKRGGFLAVSRLLKEIKIVAPISFDQLLDHLRETTPELPKEWLSNKLDLLRKDGFIFRMSNELYVLTERGLNFSGSGRSRLSADVKRVLELNKRMM